MDEYVDKKAAGGRGFSSEGSSIVFRDQNHEDRSTHHCNRSGCSTRLNSVKGTQILALEKAKYSKANFHSMSSKTVAGNSLKSLSSSSVDRKPFHERRKQTLQQGKGIAESSNRQRNIEDSECNNAQHLIKQLDIKWQGIEDSVFSKCNPSKVGIQTVLPDSEELEVPVLEQVSTNTSESSGSCTIAASSRSHAQINHHLGSGNQDVSHGQINHHLGSGNQDLSSRSFFSHSTYASRNSDSAGSPGLQGLGAGAQRCGLKSLICTSASDVLPSGDSSSDFSHNRHIEAVRKRLSGGENSTVKGKGRSDPPAGRHSGSTHTEGITGSSRSLPDHLLRQQILDRIRNRRTSRDDAVSVRTGRASTRDANTRPSEQGVGNIIPVHEPIMIAHPQQNQVSISETVPESSSRSSSIELPHVLVNSSGHPGSSSRAPGNRMVSRPEDSSTHILRGSLGDSNGYRRIAEVLLALERLEQVVELTDEQLWVLERNLFLGDLSFHDQHRDMRMDIDNMSYEELLALEEKMGTVNTGLSTDQLSECLKRSIYAPASEVSGITGSSDDTKCSICQEEYVSGDEVGNLACAHHYHVACIHQWLGLKNWCPVCKASAIAS